MPKKSKNLVELQVLENVKPVECLVEEEEEELQASKLEPVIPTPKKERKKMPPKTAKQLEVMAKGREIMMENARKRRVQRAEEDIIAKEEKEEKIVKVALSIKRKQIKRESILDEVSGDEDDTPIQKPKRRVTIREPPPPPPPPQYMFV